MSQFLYRHLRVLSALAVVPWLVILSASVISLVTSALTFDDLAYYSASITLGIAILATTLVAIGVQELASAKAGAPVRGAALLGFTSAALAAVFVFSIPWWGALLIWSLVLAVLRSHTTGLTSPAMRAVVLVGIGVFALAIPVAGFLNLTADLLGTTLWTAALVLSAAVISWHVELWMRAAHLPDIAPDAAPPASS